MGYSETTKPEKGHRSAPGGMTYRNEYPTCEQTFATFRAGSAAHDCDAQDCDAHDCDAHDCDVMTGRRGIVPSKRLFNVVRGSQR